MKFKIYLLILTIAFAAGAFYLGYKAGVRNPNEIIVRGITNIGDDDVKADFGIFWETLQKIRELHIDGANIDEKKLVYGAVSGMVNSLGDPNTIFLPPDDSKKFSEDISGSFGGIGAEIGMRNEQLIVIAPLKDSPAERAGLRSGDKILKVDDEVTGGLNVIEAVKLIRGPVGEKVILTVFREDWEAPKDITIIREVIKIPTLDLKFVDGDLAHIKLHSFNESAAREFHEAIVKAISKNAQGLILDLRNDPGGFLEVAVHLAGWFLDRGTVVVTEEFRSGEKKVFRTSGNEALKDAAVVILVNGGSASASEILAGALRDHKKIKLIGEKTFGKGTVQQLEELRGGASLKVTVAHWLLPSGLIIEKNGLKPDIEVKLTEEDVKAQKDPQLSKAIEVLRSEIAQKIGITAAQ